MKGAQFGNGPIHPNSLDPGGVGQLAPSKQDRQNVPEGSVGRRGRTQSGNGDKPSGCNESERRLSPVSITPAVITARAGSGAAEPLFVGRRLPSMADQSGTRSHRDSRGEVDSMQGQHRGVMPETPPGLPPPRGVTEDIRPEAEIPRDAWMGSRRGSYERRRGVMPLEQRAPASATLSTDGGTA
jgi:hypothetical protein